MDGNWSEWTAWTACTVTCGNTGNRDRTRTCDDPAPAGTGADCAGDSNEVEECLGQEDCPPGIRKGITGSIIDNLPTEISL